MPRRTLYDPLQAISRTTWLVVRNKHRQPLESKEIAPGVDLRPILQAALAERTAADWTCTDIGPACGFLFAERADA
jgi:hypothetical protein